MDDFDYRLVDETVSRIVKEYSPEMIIIFGSVARHEAKPWSDIDMLIVMDDDRKPILPSIRIRMSLCDINVDKDIIVITPDDYERMKDDEYSFISEIVKTGYVAYKIRRETSGR